MSAKLNEVAILQSENRLLRKAAADLVEACQLLGNATSLPTGSAEKLAEMNKANDVLARAHGVLVRDLGMGHGDMGTGERKVPEAEKPSYSYRFLGEFFGGPYDGLGLSGGSKPLTVEVDRGLMQITKDAAGVITGSRRDHAGCYVNAADFVRIDGKWESAEVLIEDDGTLAAKADSVPDGGGGTIILVRSIYQWMPGQREE